ncbi:MAG: RidA family protein [Pseudomonadota bacterium]
MTIRALVPDSIAPPFARYAHGVGFEASAGIVVMTSGQLGLSTNGEIPEDEEAQADICFSNIDAILAEEGADASHVLRINAYVTDRAYMQGYMKSRDRWLADVTRLPSSTLVIVSGFTRPEFKVEVEVTAGVPLRGRQKPASRRWWSWGSV